MTNVRQILSKLVSFPILGGDPNMAIVDYITDYLDKYDVEYHLIPNKEGTKALIHARIGPAVDGGIILSGHTDVVPVTGQDWDTDPFVLTEKNGHLYARGACDMKGFLACCLALIPEMTKAVMKRPVYLAFSYDEEIGCLTGTEMAEAIRDYYEERPQFAIIGEASMLQPIIGHKGICIYKTTVYGSAGHSSRIRQEVSAIHEAARLIIWLEDKMNSLIAAGHVDNRFTPPHTSMHVGKLHGGIAPNVIADECTFYWDVRNIPRDKIEDIREAFEAHTKAQERILQKRFEGARIETLMDHPLVTALDTPDHLAVVPLIRKLTGIEKIDTVAYAAEAGQFSEVGFESVICGPGSIAQAHRANEFISIEQLDLGVEFIRRVLKHSCE